MIQPQKSHRERVIDMPADRGLARLSELIDARVTVISVARLDREGVIVRLGRGLYQLADATAGRASRARGGHQARPAGCRLRVRRSTQCAQA